MKKTDVDFMLTLANLMSKLEQGESCAEQLQEIAKMSDENKESITHQLMDRIASREELMYVDAVLAIGYLDADYVQDFAQAMSAKPDRRLPKTGTCPQGTFPNHPIR